MNRLSILFLDVVAYKPYNADTLQKEALGGSEASLIRVARGLARRGHDVSVFQAVDCHRDEAVIQGVRHVHDSSNVNPDVVIHFRTGELMASFRETYPKARHLMWTQDFFSSSSPDSFCLKGEEIICLSTAHQENIELVAEAQKWKPKAIHRIYNMVEVDGHKLDKVPGRLGFFSSPHKGLSQVLDTYSITLRGNNRMKDISLVVGNPGYFKNNVPIVDVGVTYLGELSHPRVMEELSKCEVLFYPQTVFPETFGIILAEANAMGVPVLAHDFGAASEVLDSHTNAVLNCTDPNHVKLALDILLKGNQPKPTLDPRFTPDAVIDAWEALLVP